MCLFHFAALGQPRDVVKSLVPAANSFVFFEVTPISFHQASEYNYTHPAGSSSTHAACSVIAINAGRVSERFD